MVARWANSFTICEFASLNSFVLGSWKLRDSARFGLWGLLMEVCALMSGSCVVDLPANDRPVPVAEKGRLFPKSSDLFSVDSAFCSLEVEWDCLSVRSFIIVFMNCTHIRAQIRTKCQRKKIGDSAEEMAYLVLSFDLTSCQSLFGKNQVLFIHVLNGKDHTEGCF